jgi:hypothetical protein
MTIRRIKHYYFYDDRPYTHKEDNVIISAVATMARLGWSNLQLDTYWIECGATL